MKFLWFLLPGFLAAALSLALTPLVRHLAFLVGAVDLPGPRKVHRVPTARMGGLAVVVAVTLVLGAMWVWPGPLGRWTVGSVCTGLSLGLLPILGISIWDDIRPLPMLPKLGAHAIGAAVAMLYGVTLNPTVHLFGSELGLGLLSLPLSFFWLVGVTNAFNLVDGLDGLSAGLAFISAASLVGVFLVANQKGTAVAALVLAGGLLGFLPYNIYPAKIFLGDTGATAVGFALACFSLAGGSTLQAGFATLVPIVVLGLPVAETLVSMARRVVRRAETHAGTGVFEADRGHFHHRLLELGIDHRRAVLILYGVGVLMATTGLVSILVTRQQAGLLLIALLIAAFAGLSRLGYDEFALLRKGQVLRLYEAPVLKRAMFVVFVDLLLVCVAVWVAIALKYDMWWIGPYRIMAVEMAAVLAPVTVAVLWRLRHYRGAWRLASLDDAMKLTTAVLVSAFGGFGLNSFLFAGVAPVTVFVLYAIVATPLIVGVRLSYRVLLSARARASAAGTPVVIYGAGRGGAVTLRELFGNERLGLKPVGFLDDDPEKAGQVVNGIPVLGSLEALEVVATEYPRLTVIVSSGRIPLERLRLAEDLCERLKMRVLRLELSFREMVLEPSAPAALGEVPTLESVDVPNPGMAKGPERSREC